MSDYSPSVTLDMQDQPFASFEKLSQELSAKQNQAIPLLAAGKTGKDVASALKCNPATISKWLNHDTRFKYALMVFSEQCLGLAQVRLQALASDAIDELHRLLCNAESDQVRLKAVELILSSIGLDGAANQFPLTKQYPPNVTTQMNAQNFSLTKLVEALGGM